MISALLTENVKFTNLQDVPTGETLLGATQGIALRGVGESISKGMFLTGARSNLEPKRIEKFLAETRGDLDCLSEWERDTLRSGTSSSSRLMEASSICMPCKSLANGGGLSSRVIDLLKLMYLPILTLTDFRSR